MAKNNTPIPVDSLNAISSLVRTLRLVWRLLRDPRVPRWSKLIVPAAVVYVLSPIDLLPDLILGLGQVDDLVILFMSVSFFIQACPRYVVEEHRRALGELVASADESGEDVIEGSYRVVRDHDPSAKR